MKADTKADTKADAKAGTANVRASAYFWPGSKLPCGEYSLVHIVYRQVHSGPPDPFKSAVTQSS
eukprot:6140696-Pleurochrysis_carterae.AAC.1